MSQPLPSPDRRIRSAGRRRSSSAWSSTPSSSLLARLAFPPPGSVRGREMSSDPIARLTVLLAKLPGVGEKTAQRLAFHILKSPPEYARDLAAALSALRDEVRLCSSCCNLTPHDPCPLCKDPHPPARLLSL